VNDVALLRKVGLAACPADARPEVREVVHFVARSPGGRGAVRELCDLVLRAKGIAVL
jgi:3-deoxy-D-manno-octulosonate 8-phosphate phosphatase (KDO 8-P phosphatase)